MKLLGYPVVFVDTLPEPLPDSVDVLIMPHECTCYRCRSECERLGCTHEPGEGV